MSITEYKPHSNIRKYPSFGEQRRGLRRYGTKTGKRNVGLGAKVVNVYPGDDLQKMINGLNKDGGGIMFFNAGTYIIKTALTGISAIQFIGENTSTVILDFSSTSANLTFTGTSAYTTGTITSITSGVSVTGSGTLWLANLTTDHQFFIANRWYKIAAITSDTTLILSEGYAGGATFPGAAYRAVKIKQDIEFKEMTLKSSTGTAIDLDDCRNVTFDGVQFISNNKGVTADNCSELLFDETLIVSSTSNGLELNTCGFTNANSLSTPSNGGHGVVFNNFRIGSFYACSSDANTSDGYNITSTSILQLNCEASSNGGQGIELVSGNTGIIISNTVTESNTSDGIKLTATSDDVIITNSFINSNGGYGVNIAASTCDNNLIIGSKFASNVTAAYTNSGTGTLIRSNIGAADN